MAAHLLYKRRPGFFPSPLIARLVEEEETDQLGDICIQLQEAFEWCLDRQEVDLDSVPKHLRELFEAAKGRMK